MTLHRFFVPPDRLSGERFAIPVEIERQVRSVLRLRDGDRLVLLGGDGTEHVCHLEDDDCVVEDRRPAVGEPAHRLTVSQALLRGDHLEPVIRHGTEIGIAEFRLFVSDRCVARDISPRRLERLRAIAREAAEQSERGVIPPVLPPVPFTDALAERPVLLYERGTATRLSQVTLPRAIVIGPEGGFTAAEVDVAERAGAVVAGLGPRILRSETVAVAAAAVILSRSGDFA